MRFGTDDGNQQKFPNALEEFDDHLAARRVKKAHGVLAELRQCRTELETPGSRIRCKPSSRRMESGSKTSGRVRGARHRGRCEAEGRPAERRV